MPRRYRYQTTHSLADRKRESLSLRSHYPNFVPIVCEPAPDSGPLAGRRQILRELDCSKFLLPQSATMQQLILLLRSRLLLPEDEGLFLFVDNATPPISACVSDLYAQKKDADGFLYMTYGIEGAFGFSIDVVA